MRQFGPNDSSYALQSVTQPGHVVCLFVSRVSCVSLLPRHRITAVRIPEQCTRPAVHLPGTPLALRALGLILGLVTVTVRGYAARRWSRPKASRCALLLLCAYIAGEEVQTKINARLTQSVLCLRSGLLWWATVTVLVYGQVWTGSPLPHSWALHMQRAINDFMKVRHT